MTSEEINRTVEFILQHQAQTSVHLEDVAKSQARHEHLFGQMAIQGKRMSELIEIQSRRLEASEKQHEELMKEFRNRLDRILDKLP